MSYPVVITVLSRDRVGIIAAVTRPLVDMAGVVDAISQTVLRGYFTIILTVDFPAPVPLDEVRRRIEGPARDGLSVSVQERDPAAARPVVAEGGKFVLTITGEHRVGLVNRMATYLASRHINIVDFVVRREGSQVVIIGQLQVPPDQDLQQLQIDLAGLWKESRVQVSLQHEDIFVATNEVDFHHAAAPRR